MSQGGVMSRADVARWVCLALCLFAGPSVSAIAPSSGEQVMQGFISAEAEKNRAPEAIVQKERHQVLFIMGVVLLIGIATTVGLGIAMAVYGKPVFVAHMISAGFSFTLAIIHAIVAIVWFYPF